MNPKLIGEVNHPDCGVSMPGIFPMTHPTNDSFHRCLHCGMLYQAEAIEGLWSLAGASIP